MEYYIITLSYEPKDIGVKNRIYQINIEEKIMNLNNNNNNNKQLYKCKSCDKPS